MPTFYELCESGGQYFIRRTRRVGQKTVIDESGRVIHSKAMVTWAQLLDGIAC
ncbi:hypothetical protein ACIBQ1_07250 [Nonomuraea sp. NPDC050153]|uniref:hypothetical protein n=1 Tax=Nonomuraea sp. NPDC050153 TaxID=3364359 RepID=UPI00378D0BFB